MPSKTRLTFNTVPVPRDGLELVVKSRILHVVLPNVITELFAWTLPHAIVGLTVLYIVYGAHGSCLLIHPCLRRLILKSIMHFGLQTNPF